MTNNMSEAEVRRKEEEVGVWRRSRWTWSFWWRFLATFSLYYWTLWRRNQITVTTYRVMQRRGDLLGGEETAISIENITDINIDTPALGAIFNYGDIEVQSAGSGEAEVAFTGLGRVKELRNVLFDLKDGTADEAAKERMEERRKDDE
jgi:hypothetical protein